MEFANTFDLVIANTWFTKTRNQLITFKSGNSESQIDYILTNRRHLKDIINCNTIPGEAVVSQHRLIILSGILPVFGNRIDGYRNSKRVAINGMVKRLCKEEDVGYLDLWDSFVGKEEMYLRDGLHLSGKGAAVFAEGLSGAVASGLGKVRYLN